MKKIKPNTWEYVDAEKAKWDERIKNAATPSESQFVFEQAAHHHYKLVNALPMAIRFSRPK